MLKAGIFLDLENLSRTGSRGCRYGVIRKLVEAQRAMILRANTYLAIDVAREGADPAYCRVVVRWSPTVAASGRTGPTGASVLLPDAAVGRRSLSLHAAVRVCRHRLGTGSASCSIFRVTRRHPGSARCYLRYAE
jgi:hypothetical protein